MDVLDALKEYEFYKLEWLSLDSETMNLSAVHGLEKVFHFHA